MRLAIGTLLATLASSCASLAAITAELLGLGASLVGAGDAVQAAIIHIGRLPTSATFIGLACSLAVL